MENKKRLIDANALEGDIKKMYVPYGDGTYSGDKEAMIYDEALVDVLEALDKAPTVDAVEVVHGLWLRIGSTGKLSGKRVWGYVCSECKTLGSPQWKCCPVCTARMDGGNEDG